MSSVSETTPLHIVELRAENIKRLQAVQIHPSGELVVIGGRNAQGKSSTLDAIEMALGGASTIPPDPIRHGARKGRVVVDLGELVIERVFTPKGTSLTVTSKDGTLQKSPQALLDSLCSSIAFDPVAFARLEPKKQDEVLKRVLGLDFAELDADRAKLFAARTDTKRELKGLEARLDAMPAPEAGLPKAEQSAADILAEVEQRQAQRAENEKARAFVVELEREHRGLGSDLQALDRRIAELEEKLAEARSDREAVAERRDSLTASIERKREEVAALVDPDLDEPKARLATLEATNRKVRQVQERAKLEAEAKKLAARADELTGAIEAIDEKKAAALASAKFPVEGLGFDELGPTLHGAPLEQASQAEKLRLSVAIGAALNPRLRVMLLRDGSVLDDDGMRLLAELAQAHGLQLWCERVGDRDASAIIIEDGMVRGAGEASGEGEAAE